MDDAISIQDWPRHARYLPAEFRARAITVMPGECKFSRDGTVFSTLLGSCVSLCLIDPVAHVGGMNHFMLPGEYEPGQPVSSSARFGGYAMEFLINEVMKLGAVRQRLEAKLFGGANFITEVFSVGDRNIKFAKYYLANERIPVVSYDLGGDTARRIYFNTSDGRVMLKRLRGNMRRIVEREQVWESRVLSEAMPHEVTLFE